MSYVDLQSKWHCICFVLSMNDPCMNYRAVFRAHSSSSRAEMMILLQQQKQLLSRLERKSSFNMKDTNVSVDVQCSQISALVVKFSNPACLQLCIALRASLTVIAYISSSKVIHAGIGIVQAVPQGQACLQLRVVSKLLTGENIALRGRLT